MKRWQDRGEVADSDEEDIELRLDSPSPERPQKRAKLDGENEPVLVAIQKSPGQVDAVDDSNDEDELTRLPATVATTYRGRGKLVRPTASRRLNSDVVRGTIELERDPTLADQPSPQPSRPPSPTAPPTFTPTAQDKEDPITTQTGLSQDALLRTQPDHPAIARHPSLGNLLTHSEESSEPLRVTGAQDGLANHGFAIGQSDDGLPDSSNIFGTHRVNTNGFFSSGGSSPLSEREITPPLPPELATLMQAAQSPSASTDSNLDQADDGQDSEVDPEAREFPDSTTRRSFRARKEIQLHPYLIEKAKYQKQCKERGVRPVRLVQPESQLGDTQSGSQGSQGQYDELLSSSPAPVNEVRHLSPTKDLSAELHYFDKAGDSSDGGSAAGNRLSKRRKLTLGSAALKSATAIQSQLDEFSVPPSPPRTSSDAGISDGVTHPSHIGRTASGFRYLTHRSPAPLPTPDVSSEVKRTDVEEGPSSDSGPRTAKKSRTRRGTGNSTVSSGSASSSSDDESEAELEARRLREEQKRIRGVLPASWLKIDLQKQIERKRPTPTATYQRTSVSPEKRRPQKGVAKRITSSRPPGVGTNSAIVLSDDDIGSDGSMQEHNAVPLELRAGLTPDRFTTAPSEMIDDDVMENDFVDAMLAGPSRAPRSTKKRIKQPRITDAFYRASSTRTDLSGERSARQRAGVISEKRPSRPNQQTYRHHRRRPPPVVLLSIADAPASPPLPGIGTPQFVRLAMRQARRQPDLARHSPTQKRIRLATAEDTEEAFSVLRAWRGGAIGQRHNKNARGSSEVSAIPGQGPQGSEDRSALAEMSGNSRQQLFPAPIRKAPASHLQRANKESASRNIRFRQTQLQRTVLQDAPVNATDILPPTQIHGNRRRRETTRAPLQQKKLRTAQLETLQRDFDQDHRAQVFERRMQCLTENVALPACRSKLSEFQMARFLYSDNEVPGPPVQSVEGLAGRDATAVQQPALPRRSRKAQARRLDTEAHQYRQPSEPLVVDLEEAPVVSDFSGPVLQGLGPFGTRYPVDFDIRPLHIGTFFRNDTFIGSGEFRDALQVCQRNLDEQYGRMRVHLNSQVLHWGAWNEELAADVARIPNAISTALQTLESPFAETEQEAQVKALDQNVDYLVRSVVRYCAKCLHFVDPIDRQMYVESICRFVADLDEVVNERQAICKIAPRVFTRMHQYMVVLLKQASLIADHHVLPRDVKHEVSSRFQAAARHLVQDIVRDHFHDLRSAYEDSHRSSKRETGYGEDAWTLSSIVILKHTLSDCFWSAMEVAFHANIESISAVGDFEKLWQNFISILPALDLDISGGIARSASGLLEQREDWSLAAAILRRTLALYDDTSKVRGFTVNDYVRALLTRCHCLVTKWGWSHCEPVLYAIYDFFAGRGLAFLNNEESRGSPKFLEELSSQPTLEVLPDDRSFHIFLKILASGMLGMRQRQVYKDSQIASRAWRLIPNHSRVYGKNMDMKQADRDALRNHHDLLCTLYYALPPEKRPGVHLFRALVDHAASHRGACHVNVRSWANITNFQASTQEPIDRLAALTEWFADILKTTLAQFRLAKTEAEHDYENARLGGADMSDVQLQGTVAHNQKQIAATIVDALAGLKRCLESASSVLAIRALVEGTSFWTVLELFDPSQHRLVSTMIEVLQVMDTALKAEETCRTSQTSQAPSDDSQEFGDSSALQEFANGDGPGFSSHTKIVEALLGPAGAFLSNAFGADSHPDDALLLKIVDVWVHIANSTIKALDRSWLSYVDEYSSTSWNQIRDTRQKRKFTTYFMARVAEQQSIDEDVRQRVLNAWFLSLVEREAALKFQHTLTSTLLNHCGDERLLQDLPFHRDNSSGNFHITLDEFRQRRLAVISSVLCNMRESLFETDRERPRLMRETLSAYAGLLRQLMNAMKSHYQDLQADPHAETADADVQGSYVEFVQHVVSLLQQHTGDICKVDSFFTDSNAFPLPAGDPTYVIGKLKGYVRKLHESNTRIGLAVFVQAVSERAAVDGEQPYLVGQLSAAMSGVPEAGDRSMPTLRHVLLTSVFPAYFINAIGTACGWILALPLLEACEHVIADLYYNVQVNDEKSALASVETMLGVLHSINGQCELALTHAGLLVLPHVLKTLAAMFDICCSTLPLASIIQRCSSHGAQALNYLKALHSQSRMIEESLTRAMDLDRLGSGLVSTTPSCPWPNSASYAEDQARDTLKRFHTMDGRYLMQRVGTSTLKEVQVQLSSQAEEQRRLLQAILRFGQAYDATFIPRARGRIKQVAWEDACGLKDVLV